MCSCAVVAGFGQTGIEAVALQEIGGFARGLAFEFLLHTRSPVPDAVFCGDSFLRRARFALLELAKVDDFGQVTKPG